MTPKAIIFDLGNVIFICSFENTINYWSDLTSISTKELRKRLDFTEKFHKDFEKGIISPDDFRKELSNQIEYNLSKTEFEKGWNSIYENLIDGVEALLSDLKHNYKIIALTNTNLTHSFVWQEKYKNILTHFEKVFSSHEIKYRKPELESYKICVNYLNVKPNEIIFLDDRLENLKGAEKIGIKTILVKSFPQMEEELKVKLLE